MWKSEYRKYFSFTNTTIVVFPGDMTVSFTLDAVDSNSVNHFFKHPKQQMFYLKHLNIHSR